MRRSAMQLTSWDYITKNIREKEFETAGNLLERINEIAKGGYFLLVDSIFE